MLRVSNYFRSQVHVGLCEWVSLNLIRRDEASFFPTGILEFYSQQEKLADQMWSEYFKYVALPPPKKTSTGLEDLFNFHVHEAEMLW
jgi:hypothetical protein